VIKACIYKDDPGPILRVISSSNIRNIQLNIKDGQKYTPSDASPDTHYIKNGKVVAYPDKPDHPCYFDFNNERWVLDSKIFMAMVRKQRDRLLERTDWTQSPDAPVNHAAWAEYRQKLRDLPSTVNNNPDFEWPLRPE
jgi:hypothetical protein